MYYPDLWGQPSRVEVPRLESGNFLGSYLDSVTWVYSIATIKTRPYFFTICTQCQQLWGSIERRSRGLDLSKSLVITKGDAFGGPLAGLIEQRSSCEVRSSFYSTCCVAIWEFDSCVDTQPYYIAVIILSACRAREPYASTTLLSSRADRRALVCCHAVYWLRGRQDPHGASMH